MLFESTRYDPLDMFLQNRNSSIRFGCWSSWWARVDCASRTSKKAPQGLFCRRGVWRRPMLFESTRYDPLDMFLQNRNSSTRFGYWSSWWARVDVASRASKKAPQGLFYPPDCSAGRCCSNPPTFVSLTHKQNKNLSVFAYVEVFWWARVDSNNQYIIFIGLPGCFSCVLAAL